MCEIFTRLMSITNSCLIDDVSDCLLSSYNNIFLQTTLIQDKNTHVHGGKGK